MSKKYYIKPFGVVAVAAIAFSLTAGAAFMVQTGDKSNATEKPAEIEIQAGQPQPIAQRTYYRVHDGNASAMLGEEYQSYIYDMCEKYGIEGYEQLVVALFYKESSFRFDAVSSSGDYGIAQINKGNHEWLRDTLGVTDFLDPYQSIECGVFMLANALEVNGGSISKALVAYNAGQKAVNAGLTENDHSRKVLSIIGNMTEESVEFIF